MTSGKFNDVWIPYSISFSLFKINLNKFAPALLLISRIESNRVTHSNDVNYYRTHRTKDVYYENQENSVMY